MLHTIVNINDVFYESNERSQHCRSSNPYDYIRTGYFIDNAELYGGYNNVNLNCNSSSNSSSNSMGVPN